MPNRLLIETTTHGSRVAILEEGQLVEVQIEAADDRSVVGDIYKGRVSRVVPGIQAAFVDVGLARDAYLFSTDVQSVREQAEDDLQNDEQSGQETLIDKHLEVGQQLLVQVTKEPLPGKGARITSQISLPGRLMVLLPGATAVGVSRRIVDQSERERLQGILEAIKPPACGLIARTAAAGRGAGELADDIDRLWRRFDVLQLRATDMKAPALVERELTLPLRAVRDLLDDSHSEIWLEENGTESSLLESFREIDPESADRVRFYRGETSMFEFFGVEEGIEKALHSRVFLESGGDIVINLTEALVAIDVNTGRFTGSDDLATTALQTNVEAARAIAHQLRLRDLGGIIVVDFIDMALPEHRSRVLQVFEQELSKDRVRSQISGISEFGLVQVTRKRTRVDLMRSLTQDCPCCQGRGWVRSVAGISRALQREVLRRAPEIEGKVFRLRVHPTLAQALGTARHGVIGELEQRLGKRIEVDEDPNLRLEGYEIVGE